MGTAVTHRKVRSPKTWAAFLAALEATGNVTKACKKAGVAMSTVYDRRESNAKFAAAWEAALDRAVVQLEDEARRRAHDGTLKPVFYKGSRCGQVREYSDTLLIFLLKAARPDKYRERVSAELSGPGGGPLKHLSASVQVTAPELRAAVLSALEKV